MLLGKHETETKISSFEYKRVVVSKLAIPTALSILTFFPIYNYVLHNLGAALVMSMALITYLILTPVFYKQYGLIFVGRFSLFVLYICIFLLMYDLKADNYFTVWVFCYLLYALVLHGHVWGTILSAILFAYTIWIMSLFLGQTTVLPEIIRYTGSALILLSIGFFYEKSNFETFKKVHELNKILKTLTTIDDLTGLHNRRFFNEVIQNFINPSEREKNVVCFMILDVDFFKQYNDTYGHQKGDITLRCVAQTVKNTLRRKDDYCFRLGGEEFGVLFKSESEANAQTFANDIIQKVQDLKISHAKNRVNDYLTLSGGLVIKPCSTIIDYKIMYKLADDMLYKAKTNGRNQIAVKAFT